MRNANLVLCSSRHFLILCLVLFISKGVSGATFTFMNKCDSTVWPGILSNAGSPVLETTGFELPKNTLRSLSVPTGWSGRFWGRTGCSFDASGSGTCATADCGSGLIACAGNGAATPVTLAEFTLGTAGGQDFYDVSLVDGFNLPMMVETTGGSGGCASTGCLVDLNRQCPTELRTSDGEACKSACVAFETPEYCCSGVYGSPETCKPSVYSSMFKVACPSSYSYAYDDATSTFTCAGADYTITFCPSTPSQKSTKDTTPQTGTGNSYQSGQGMTGTATGTGSVSGSPPGSGVVADGSWLAGLALGDATRTLSFSGLNFAGFASGVFLSFLNL